MYPSFTVATVSSSLDQFNDLSVAFSGTTLQSTLILSPSLNTTSSLSVIIVSTSTFCCAMYSLDKVITPSRIRSVSVNTILRSSSLAATALPYPFPPCFGLLIDSTSSVISVFSSSDFSIRYFALLISRTPFFSISYLGVL